MIFGPKDDGSYVVDFKTVEGEALAISIPRSEVAVIRHFQGPMPYGLFVPPYSIAEAVCEPDHTRRISSELHWQCRATYSEGTHDERANYRGRAELDFGRPVGRVLFGPSSPAHASVDVRSGLTRALLSVVESTVARSC